MPVKDAHRQVATIVLHAVAEHGFALAGGNALIMHEVIDRYTADVDIFTDEEDGIALVRAIVAGSLLAEGFGVQEKDKTGGLAGIFPGMEDGLAEWKVTTPAGELVQLQMSYFVRARRPVVIDGIRVLSLEDVAAGKACALGGRALVRDFVDVAALLEHYSPAQLIALAQRMDPGLLDDDFAAAGRRLDRTADSTFAEYHLPPDFIAWIRAQFERWPR